jgi:hypothetical protein
VKVGQLRKQSETVFSFVVVEGLKTFFLLRDFEQKILKGQSLTGTS